MYLAYLRLKNSKPSSKHCICRKINRMILVRQDIKFKVEIISLPLYQPTKKKKKKIDSKPKGLFYYKK